MRPSIPYDPRLERRRPSGWLARLGSGAIAWSHEWRLTLGTLGSALVAPLTPGRAAARVVRRVAVAQVFFTGVQGLPFVTATALLMGATLMIQTMVAAPGLPGEIVGKLLVAVVLRELAPLVTAIIVASRSGTAVATELGNMRAGLELYGLSSLGVDPARYVVFPRVLGVLVGVLVLTVYFTVLAITGSLVVIVLMGGPSVSAVHAGFSEALGWADLVIYLMKGVGCGGMVGWLCCHYGMQVKVSPTEVPRNSGRAVVRSVLGCVLYNFAITIGYYGVVRPPLGL